MKSKPREAPQSRKTPAPRNKRVAARRRAARGIRAAKATDILGGSANTTLRAGRLPAKWRWHHRVLLSLQSRLLQDRGELLQASALPIEPHSMNEADSATDEFDHDLALTQLSAGQDALHEVNEALRRIFDGSYGVCEESGEAIPSERLRAVPWTRYARAVEERLERKGVLPKAGLHKAGTVRDKGRIWLAPEEEAEEAAEAPAAPPKDEALSRVFSPPGRHKAHHKSAGRPLQPPKRKAPPR